MSTFSLFLAVIFLFCHGFCGFHNQECAATNCDKSIKKCNDNPECRPALKELSRFCEDVNKCTDIEFVKSTICNNKDFCTKQIKEIASCFINECQLSNTYDMEQTNQTVNKCFEENCSKEKEECLKNIHCEAVITYNYDLFQKTDTLNYDDVKTEICATDLQCTDLVISAAECFFQECNIEECVLNNCGTEFQSCTSNDPCHNALKLARSGHCDNIDCFDNGIQLKHLCDNNNECAQQFNAIAVCYHKYCYKNHKFVPETDKCIAKSGAHAYFDEYGNCCAELGRVDCLWELENSRCGWFFHNGEGYCYGWRGPQTCQEFKKENVNIGPVSCLFEGDCFNDYCNKEIEICQKTKNCAQALSHFMDSKTYDSNSCNQSSECLKSYDDVINCWNNNCKENEPPVTTASGEQNPITTEPK